MVFNQFLEYNIFCTTYIRMKIQMVGHASVKSIHSLNNECITF